MMVSSNMNMNFSNLWEIMKDREARSGTMKYFDGIIQYEHEFQQTLGDSEEQRGLEWYRCWSCKKLDTSE